MNPASSFIRHVGLAVIHDGLIVFMERSGDLARVVFEDIDGARHLVEFTGLSAVHAIDPEGLRLYALSELTAEMPLRRFLFVPWDDRDPRSLEIIAKDVRFEISE